MREKLGLHCDVISGYAFSTSDWREEGIPVVKIGNISNGEDILCDEQTQYVNESFLDKLDEKYHISKGDVLISLTGSHINQPNSMVGRTCRSLTDRKYLLNQRAGKVLPFDGINKNYLYYLLSTKAVKYDIANRAYGGANQVNVSPKDIKKIKWEFPDLEIQNKIANVLSTYDELIENNNKRIAILEQMAENLYKEWFVRRKNEKWELVKLSQFGYSLESGSRPKGGIDNSLQEGCPSLGAEAIGDLGKFDYSATKLIPEDFYRKMKRGIGRDKDILLYKDGAYIGKVTLFMDDFPYKDYAVNEHVFLMRSNNPIYQYYLYFTLALPQYFTQMQNLNRNAAQPGLTGKDIDILKLYLPDEETVLRFNATIEPMLHQIFSLAKQNENLKKQRDLLLPRLMSGKLEV